MKKLTSAGTLPANTLLTIASLYKSLSKAEKKVAEAVQSDPHNVILLTITDLSEKAGVGDTSVIRFCRKLGFHGYQEFKLAIAQDLVKSPAHTQEQTLCTDAPCDLAKTTTQKNIRIIQDTLNFLDVNALNNAVDTLLQAKRILLCGVGASAVTALDIYHRFLRLNLCVEVFMDGHLMAMAASLVGEKDVVFGISTSGSTKDIVDSFQLARQNGAKILCITSHARSPITRISDTVLMVPSTESPFEGGLISTKIAQLHLVDILLNLLITQKAEEAQASIRKTANALANKLY